MITFNYRAKNKDGELVKGSINAVNESQASQVLDAKGLILISLVDKQKEVDLSHLEVSQHVPLKEVMIFSKQLAGMINAGMPVVECLTTIGEDEKNKYFAKVIMNLAKDVEGGQSIRSSMEKYPKIFSDIYLNLIEVGESSGKLAETLTRLSDQLEKDYRLRSQVKGAMIYPAFVLTTLVAVALIAVTFVFPKLTPILKMAGVKLPFITQVLIFFSEGFMKYWYGIVPGIIGTCIFLFLYTRKGGGNILWSDLKIRIPIAGNILKDIYMARFLRTLSILLTGGVSITKSLEITSKAIGNIHYETEILKAMEDVKGGIPLSKSFENSKYISNIVKRMIKTGEKTGSLDQISEKLADFYESEVENQINNLSKTLEPVLVLIMGVAVALFVAAVIIPLYDATTSVQKL